METKTIKEWLKKVLSEDDFRLALKYEGEHWGDKNQYFSRSLIAAFKWEASDEGADYWLKIFRNNEYINNETTWKTLKKN